MKRFVISGKADGRWIVSVFAERYEVYEGVGNSLTGAQLGNFYVGQEIVASVDASQCEVAVSGEATK